MPDKTTGGDSNRPRPQYLLLGKILRPHGIRGELRMKILTDYPERIPALETVYLGRTPTSSVAAYAVEGMRSHKGYGLLKLKSIDTRNQAEELRQLSVMVDIENAVPLEKGELYLFQLIGLSVQTEDGETLGTVTEVLETGANDVYIVDSPKYGEILIPATEETIIETDVEAGSLTVGLPDGLLPLP